MSAQEEPVDSHPLEPGFFDFFYRQILYAKKILVPVAIKQGKTRAALVGASSFLPSAVYPRAKPHRTPREHTLKTKTPHFTVQELRAEGKERHCQGCSSNTRQKQG